MIKFHAANAGDSCSYIGPGFPDTVDSQIQIQHREAAGIPFAFTIGIITAGVAVSKVNLTSDLPAPATLDAGSHAITVPIGMGVDSYRTNLLDLGSLVSEVAADRLTSITSFNVTLDAPGDIYLDNFTVGNIQPDNSLSFSYDVYNGQEQYVLVAPHNSPTAASQ